MAQPYNQQSGVEARWDIPRWVSLSEAFVSSFTVSPTAALPGLLAVWPASNAATIFSIRASATAVISYTLNLRSTDPGLGTPAPNNMNLGSSPSGIKVEFGVGAAPSGLTPGLGEGVLPANDIRELLAPGWFRVQFRALVLVTGLVACNVSFTVMYTEDGG